MTFKEKTLIEFDINPDIELKTIDYRMDKWGINLQAVIINYNRWLKKFSDNMDKEISIRFNTEFGNEWYLSEMKGGRIHLILKNKIEE